MKIGIIGSGNIAFHLAKKMDETGYQVKEIYSRNHEKAQELAELVNAKALKNIQEFSGKLLLFFCVPDDVIAHLSQQISERGIHVHCSGATDVSSLQSGRKGVFYPLHSFSKSKEVLFEKIHILIEGSDVEVINELETMAMRFLSGNSIIDSTQRLKLHLAAVFASNFSNLMIDYAQEILEKEGMSPKILLPLVEESVEKLTSLSAFEAQTGPAIRKDFKTIEKHQSILKSYPEDYQNIYKILSDQIIKRHGEL